MEKPESNITFEALTTNVSTIAHWVQASKQILADAAMLESYIDGRLRYGLTYVEEDQILNGDGTTRTCWASSPRRPPMRRPSPRPT